ncbi:MAG TPA: hypothetical protein VFW38_07920 [Solirubrobacteraceae bacterium]|nr:hypothetical protein [Solirubrobacteraceae bacterium]
MIENDERLIRADQITAAGAAPLLAAWTALHTRTRTHQELTNRFASKDP